MSHEVIFDKWWDNDNKNISLLNYRKPWKENGNPPMFRIRTNGAKKKNGDSCFDLFIHFGYLILIYTNFNLQGKKHIADKKGNKNDN